ncbi:phasin family protein [Lusitaniella coriacea]|uniref:phasin family protein n=1 Tax=Lusitaniella coriacea TaxID=1983105 RepID=UPI003CEF10F6
MPGLGDLVQKAFYMGVGLASFAGEKASVKLQELRVQAQKLADEMVKRGEMTAEEASKFVDDLVQQAQQPPVESSTNQSREPRRIEIVEDEEENSSRASSSSESVENLRDQVQSLQEELRNLQKD